MKKIQEMSEEEILAYISDLIKNHVQYYTQTGEQFCAQACVEMVFKNLRDYYDLGLTLGFLDTIMEQDLIAREALVEKYTPFTHGMIAQLYLDHTKQLMTAEINRTMAEAILNSAFEARGLEIKTTHFQKRADVYVHMVGRKWARFQIKYTDLTREGCLDDLISAVLDLRNAVVRIGRRLTVGTDLQ